MEKMEMVGKCDGKLNETMANVSFKNIKDFKEVLNKIKEII